MGLLLRFQLSGECDGLLPFLIEACTKIGNQTFCAHLVCFVCFKEIESSGRKPNSWGGNVEGSKGLVWSLLMLIILLTNGMSSFGLKVIASWALPGSIERAFLTCVENPNPWAVRTCLGS